LVRNEFVAQSPATQVASLYSLQSIVGLVVILIFFLLSAIGTGLTALVRSLFGIKDIPAPIE